MCYCTWNDCSVCSTPGFHAAYEILYHSHVCMVLNMFYLRSYAVHVTLCIP